VGDVAVEPQPKVGLLDTSILIAREAGRRLDETRVPRDVAVSVVTIGELQLGVLMAPDDISRSQRLETLGRALQLGPIPVDGPVASAWALLTQRLKADGKRMDLNDSWIAATAIARGWVVVTQDDGFPDMIPGLTVIRT
jgi:predicted nucleic acid-binding protein